MSQVGQSEAMWRESRDKWAKIWFEKLSRFHGRKPQATWEFTADEVIAFLRDHEDEQGRSVLSRESNSPENICVP